MSNGALPSDSKWVDWRDKVISRTMSAYGSSIGEEFRLDSWQMAAFSNDQIVHGEKDGFEVRVGRLEFDLVFAEKHVHNET